MKGWSAYRIYSKQKIYRYNNKEKNFHFYIFIHWSATALASQKVRRSFYSFAYPENKIRNWEIYFDL